MICLVIGMVFHIQKSLHIYFLLLAQPFGQIQFRQDKFVSEFVSQGKTQNHKSGTDLRAEHCLVTSLTWAFVEW